MRRLPLALLALAAIAALLVACGGSDDSGSSSDAGIPVYTDAGTEIPVKSGERFAIELQANPSTGYTWQVELPAGVTQDSDEMMPAVGQTDDAVGVPEMQRWEFTVDDAKDGTLVFSSMPPGSDQAEQTIEFNLVAG